MSRPVKRLIDTLMDVAAKLAFACDRAACTRCGAPWVRWVIVDGPDVVEHRCDDCGSDCSDVDSWSRRIDLGRDLEVTLTHLDALALRRWCSRRQRAPRGCRPRLLPSRALLQARSMTGGAR